MVLKDDGEKMDLRGADQSGYVKIQSVIALICCGRGSMEISR